MSFRGFTLSVTILLITLLSIPVVSAYTYEVYQGDTVYMDETVDISRVISWSGEWAYYNGGEEGDYPDMIVNFHDYGFMYKFKITKDKGFRIGKWFKYDGAGVDKAGYNLAFIIAPGVRNNTLISQLDEIKKGKATPVPTGQPVPESNTVIPQDTHLLLVRGDTGTLKYGLNWEQSGGINQTGYIWLFGTHGDYDLTRGAPFLTGTLAGVPMNYTSSDATSSYKFTPELSATLPEGWYTGYFQFVGKNGMQDVSYNPKHYIKFGDNRDGYYKILETPFDDEIIPDVILEGLIPMRYQQELELLAKPSKYFDDILIPITVEVVTPSISIGDYWEEADDIVIEGSTPMSAGTVITVIIDPEQYPLTMDKKEHTFTTPAINAGKGVNSKGETSGESNCITTITDLDNNGFNTSMYNGTIVHAGFSSKTKCVSIPRIFTIRIPIEWGEMGIGRHTIRASINSNGVTTSMNKDFVISGEWVNPTPTPELRKVIVVREGGSHAVSLANGSVLDSSGFPNGSITTQPTLTIMVNGTVVNSTISEDLYMYISDNESVYMNQSEFNETLHPNVNRSNVRPLVTLPPTPEEPTPEPTPTDDVSIPVNPFVVILATLVAGIVLIRRKR